MAYHEVYCLHLHDLHESRIEKGTRAASPSTAAMSQAKVFTTQDLPLNGHSMFLQTLHALSVQQLRNYLSFSFPAFGR